MSRESEVRHEPEGRRFVVEIDGRSGFLDYRPMGEGVWNLTYTYVPRQDRGGGIGRRLVLHVLDHARAVGLRVVPSCGFVATVIDEHPQYRDLVAPLKD